MKYKLLLLIKLIRNINLINSFLTVVCLLLIVNYINNPLSFSKVNDLVEKNEELIEKKLRLKKNNRYVKKIISLEKTNLEYIELKARYELGMIKKNEFFYLKKF